MISPPSYELIGLFSQPVTLSPTTDYRIKVKSMIVNLENISYFTSCSGGTISLHHSFPPSLPVRLLETRDSSHMKRQEMLVRKFEFNSYGRLMRTLPELHHTPKRCHLKRNRFDYYLLFKRGFPWAIVDPTRVIERSAESKPENRN